MGSQVTLENLTPGSLSQLPIHWSDCDLCVPIFPHPGYFGGQCTRVLPWIRGGFPHDYDPRVKSVGSPRSQSRLHPAPHSSLTWKSRSNGCISN